MERRFLISLAAFTVYIPLMLLADSDGWIHQVSLGLATALFLYAIARRSGIDGRQIVCAIIVASIGECFLSLVWGLYTYSHALIPLYVPPGHGVFYLMAAYTARQPWIQQRAQAIIRSALVSGTVIAIVSLVAFNDNWGLLWWIGAAAIILRSRNALMFAACFFYTMPLEWAGTWNDNWFWFPDVPVLPFTSANPPSGVGILYVLLDLITVALTGWLFGGVREAAEPRLDPAPAAVSL